MISVGVLAVVWVLYSRLEPVMELDTSKMLPLLTETTDEGSSLRDVVDRLDVSASDSKHADF